MTLEEESRLSFYEEIARIGENSEVLLVRHRTTGKLWVKKILNYYDLQLMQQIRQAEIANIPHIEELVEDEGRLILVEEYIHGDTLEALLAKKQNRFSIEEVTDIAMSLCDILTAIHSLQPSVVHRDIKPGNIMISSDGVVKLVDFHVARLVEKGAKQDTILLGTHQFAAPEQYGFGQSDARTDIYGLGITMNYLLTGKSPKEAQVEGKLGLIIDKCTRMAPEDRYQNAVQLKMDLLILQAGWQEWKNSGREPEYSGAFLSESPALEEQSWTPPGFRTRTLWKEIVAVLGYLFIVWLGYEVNVGHSTGIIEDACFSCIVWTTGLFIVGWGCNYRKLPERLPGMKHPDMRIRLFLRILYGIILTAAFVLCWTVIAATILLIVQGY